MQWPARLGGFQRGGFFLVVLDIGLPGEDGIDVALQLRKQPDLTIIIVSARDTLDDRLAGLKAGADR